MTDSKSPVALWLAFIGPLIGVFVGSTIPLMGRASVLDAKDNVFEIEESDLYVGSFGHAMASCPRDTKLLSGECKAAENTLIQVSGPAYAVSERIKRNLELAKVDAKEIEPILKDFQERLKLASSSELAFYCMARRKPASDGPSQDGWVHAVARCRR